MYKNLFFFKLKKKYNYFNFCNFKIKIQRQISGLSINAIIAATNEINNF